MNKEQIEKILDKWYFDNNTCTGEIPKCCIKECDLCVNCFNRLKEEFSK